MKKRTKILLALTMLVLITGFAAISFAGSNSGKNSPSEKPKEIMTPPEPGRSEYSLGDVDCNGKINSADARLALRMAVGLEILGAEQIAAADVDEDCKITAADARLILRAAVGLENFSEIDAIMREMSVREKVGQLFIVYPESLNFGSSKWEAVTDFTDAMSGALLNYPCGGVIMFGNNIVSPSQITRFNEKLLGASKIPLFICVDEEGGQVARLANNPAFGLPKYGSAAQVGAGGNPADAREMGSVIGGYLKKYGFNMDFAPVADVFTNPNNTVIGNRAFSSDAQSVASFASALDRKSVV